MEYANQVVSNKYLLALKTLGIVIMHLLLCTVGSILLSDLLIGSENALAHLWNSSITYKQASWLLTEIHGFPVQACSGLLLGFVVAWFFRQKMMMWIWVFPLFFFGFVALISPYHGTEIFSHFIGNGCNVTSHCFDQFVVTLPLVSCGGYSLGAALALKLKH